MEDRPDDRPGRAAPARPQGAGGLRRATTPTRSPGSRCSQHLPSALAIDSSTSAAAAASSCGARSRRAATPSASTTARRWWRWRGQTSGAHVVEGRAEELPFADGEFTAVSCLVAFFFMDDPVRVLRELRRVLDPATRPARDLHDAARGEGHARRSVPAGHSRPLLHRRGTGGAAARRRVRRVEGDANGDRRPASRRTVGSSGGRGRARPGLGRPLRLHDGRAPLRTRARPGRGGGRAADDPRRPRRHAPVRRRGRDRARRRLAVPARRRARSGRVAAALHARRPRRGPVPDVGDRRHGAALLRRDRTRAARRACARRA